MRSSRCRIIIAAFIAALEFDVSSTNNNICWFSNSMNWKPGLFSLRTIKRGFQFTIFLHMSLVLTSSAWSIIFQWSKGVVVTARGDGLDFVIVLRWAVRLFRVLPVMFLFEL